MKKILGIVVLGLLYFNNSIAEEYPNSWKMDINCKQGNNTWYESFFVVSVKNNEFEMGPYNRWGNKNYKWKGKIEGKKINISQTWTWRQGGKNKINYKGEFINENEANLIGRFPNGGSKPWKCKGRFFKVDRPPHFTPLKYLSEATEEIIKFTNI